MNSSRPWQELPLADSINRIPAMLSTEEKQYLTWLTKEKYEGWGAIVELGTWLGSSSASLAEGLRQRQLTSKIHSFDLFRWEEYMAAVHESDLKSGDDFLSLYLKQTAEYAPWIEAKAMDFINCSWDGGPIEILFIDSAKTWDLMNAILEAFGPHLVPGRSRVVLEDFRYYYAHCLPLIFDSRPDVWRQVEDVEYGPTVTFMPLKPLYGRAGIQTPYAEDSIPLESANFLLRSRLEREQGLNRQWILGMLYRKHVIHASVEEANKLKEELLAGGTSETELRIMEDVPQIARAVTSSDDCPAVPIAMTSRA